MSLTVRHEVFEVFGDAVGSVNDYVVARLRRLMRGGDLVIVVRFKVRCSPNEAQELKGLLAAVQAASQTVPGVVTFDIGQDLLDANAFIATEVFHDRAALDRQEALPEVQAAMEAFDGALVAPPEATIYHVESSEPYE